MRTQRRQRRCGAATGCGSGTAVSLMADTPGGGDGGGALMIPRFAPEREERPASPPARRAGMIASGGKARMRAGGRSDAEDGSMTLPLQGRTVALAEGRQ